MCRGGTEPVTSPTSSYVVTSIRQLVTSFLSQMEDLRKQNSALEQKVMIRICVSA